MKEALEGKVPETFIKNIIKYIIAVNLHTKIYNNECQKIFMKTRLGINFNLKIMQNLYKLFTLYNTDFKTQNNFYAFTNA